MIAGFDLQQLVAQPVARQLLAIGRDKDDIERGLVALRDAFVAEQRLDADHRRCRRDRQHQLAFDCAAASFRHADEDLGFLRTGRCGLLRQADGESRNPVGVRLGEIFNRGALVAGGLLIGDAELVAGESRPARGRGDQHVALQLQARGWRAIEEMAVNLKFYRRISFDLPILAG